MPFYRPKVYTASKLSAAGLWRSLRNNPTWAHVEWTARWPEMTHLEQDATIQDFSHFWRIDVTDVQRSDFVLLLGIETLDAPLRGAIFEAGVAVALGKTVITVMLNDRHTWKHHPLVCCLDTLEEARQLLLRYHTTYSEEDSNL